jgi:hypothetical protein
MGFIQIVLPCVNEIHIVTVQIHMHGNVRMMSGIIVHQWHKQASCIDHAKERKKKNVNAPREIKSIQTREFATK